MFKKFKDKLAEEVKSSPQRLQQFAQAAQAAVTSASSSISDITNNDLFSIGDNDGATKSQSSSNSQQNTFRDVSPVYQASIQSGSDLGDGTTMQEEGQRQRRLSNSSFASDISFRLPSYESPSMYHIQSDMEISASEAEEKGFNSSMVNLDRVTKEQLYAAYRHTQDRFKKYKTQYADLARHYKLLERENAKARNVLVETQDKALRRISELREQCTLEQSAKAHLERALRIEIDEKDMKIHALNTKLNLLQHNSDGMNIENVHKISNIEKESEMQLINLNDNEQKITIEETSTSEISILNTKLEKMEQLLNKYKESLKVAKEKNAQMTTELQILSNELTTKSKEIQELGGVSEDLNNSKKKIQELNEIIEELQNKCNSYDFKKNKETSILEMNLQSAHEDILKLKSKIEELKKREEEYAISLAENKLSIHKELESKEAEIKSLKDSLSDAQNETQSLHIVINDYKNNITKLESECITLKRDINDFNTTKTKQKETELQLEEILQKCHLLESSKAKLDEQFKCLQLQMKQETAEKLAMIDRNTYLETRNAQLTEENIKKSSQVTDLEVKLESYYMSKDNEIKETDLSVQKEITVWKTKYENLEKEIQDEREELIKLQSEIEKLLRNYELVQTKNVDLNHLNSSLKKENKMLQDQILSVRNFKQKFGEINKNVREVRQILAIISNAAKTSINFVNDDVFRTVCKEISVMNEIYKQETNKNKEKYNELKMNYELLEKKMLDIIIKHNETTKELQTLQEENNASNLKIEQYKTEIMESKQIINNNALEHKNSLNEIIALKSEVENLRDKVESDARHCFNMEEKLKTLETENCSLRDQLAENENHLEISNTFLNKEKELREGEVQNISKQYDSSLNEIIILKGEINNLKQKLENHDKQYSNQAEVLKTLELEKSDLIERLTDKENYILLLTENLQKEKDLCNEKMEENSVLSNSYKIVIKENDEQKACIYKLQDNIECLTQENLSLKNLAETISLNVNKLEQEINEVRSSHTEIEKQKNHLTTVIDQLEKTQLKSSLILNSDKDSQTEFINYESEETHEERKISETSSKALNSNNVVGDIEQKYDVLQNEYELIKEENRRLQSDVEGLQIYLTKISKENSALNDKLRDYFISSENLPEKQEAINHDIEEFKSEIQYGKEKIENLIRENTMLIEENLELKDQIQLHSYKSNTEIKPSSDDNNTEQELQIIQNKYRSLLDDKINLEKKLLGVEQMNLSVTENVHHMQVNNEKLRLSNEKLERRLDEALVSLRHLHALQENTELEYLRNILYEYLTGSGTHSLTLAKVLSAVVKFNDSQTDLVLQKERERQGFLRQLGLL